MSNKSRSLIILKDEHAHPDFRLLRQSNVNSRSAKNPQEMETNFWNDKAQKHLKRLLDEDARKKLTRAKNVIMFLGDGMSLATVAATRVYLGGEELSLSFEDFPHFGLSKVIHY